MNTGEDTVSSTTGEEFHPQNGDTRLEAPSVSGEACSSTATYRGRRKKNVDVIYTDLFLDVINYDRDKEIFFERVLNVAADDTLLLVCSSQVYRFVLNAERGNDVLNGGNVFLCDAVTGRDSSGGMLPDNPNRLVTFNVDPFDAAVSVDAESGAAASRLKRAFKTFMGSPDPPADGYARVQLVYNVFVMNERSVEAFSAVQNVDTDVTARLEFVNDHTDDETNRNIVCNYCSDAMVCVESDMNTVRVDGNMPATADASLTLDPKNLILLVTSMARLRAAPDAEYFRFKQFYHTFAYGTNNRWGIVVEGSTLWRYLCSLTTALTVEMERLFNVLKRTARKGFYAEKRRETADRGGPTYIVDPNELDESRYMEEARRKVFRAYTACPILLNTVDMRSITSIGRDCFETGLMREHARLRSEHRPLAGMDAYIEAGRRLFDTATFPAGGDVVSGTVIEALRCKEFSLNGPLVVQNVTTSSATRISYNKYFMDLLFRG